MPRGVTIKCWITINEARIFDFLPKLQPSFFATMRKEAKQWSPKVITRATEILRVCMASQEFATTYRLDLEFIRERFMGLTIFHEQAEENDRRWLQRAVTCLVLSAAGFEIDEAARVFWPPIFKAADVSTRQFLTNAFGVKESWVKS